jgi:hypothetical protein
MTNLTIQISSIRRFIQSIKRLQIIRAMLSSAGVDVNYFRVILLALDCPATYDFGGVMACIWAGAFFVTRAKSNMKAHRVYLEKTNRSTGIICDHSIATLNYKSYRSLILKNHITTNTYKLK